MTRRMTPHPMTSRTATVLCVLALSGAAHAAVSESTARQRLDADVAAGRPLVAHIVVALADNEHQGIIPVPKALGSGQAPRTNLYWGAAYGVRNYFAKKAGWTELRTPPAKSSFVLERTVFRKRIERGGHEIAIYAVADAYDGAHIREAIVDDLEFLAGRSAERVEASDKNEKVSLSAGGDAQLIIYVGHDGLMDFNVPAPAPAADGSARTAIVLACISRSYFGPLVDRAGAFSLVTTTGLMAPEAYTVDAALAAWFGGASASDVRSAAAEIYDRYQHCGRGGARRLFGAAREAR